MSPVEREASHLCLLLGWLGNGTGKPLVPRAPVNHTAQHLSHWGLGISSMSSSGFSHIKKKEEKKLYHSAGFATSISNTPYIILNDPILIKFFLSFTYTSTFNMFVCLKRGLEGLLSKVISDCEIWSHLFSPFFVLFNASYLYYNIYYIYIYYLCYQYLYNQHLLILFI